MSVDLFSFAKLMKDVREVALSCKKVSKILVASLRKFRHWNKCVCNVEIDYGLLYCLT